MASLRIENQHYRSVQEILVHLLGSYARLRNLLKHMTRESRTWSGIFRYMPCQSAKPFKSIVEQH